MDEIMNSTLASASSSGFLVPPTKEAWAVNIATAVSVSLIIAAAQGLRTAQSSPTNIIYHIFGLLVFLYAFETTVALLAASHTFLPSLSSVAGALVGALVYVRLLVVPSLYMSTEDATDDGDDGSAGVEQPRGGSSAENATLSSKPKADPEFNFNIYEPGKGFFFYHFMNMKALIATVVVALSICLLWSGVRFTLESELGIVAFCLASSAVFFGSMAWRFIPFDIRYPFMRTFQFVVGSTLTANFILFWALPLFVQGQSFKLLLAPLLRIPYRLLDESEFLRSIARKYIYTQPQCADYFATFIFSLIGFCASLGFVFYYYFTYKTIPLWLVIAYNFSWVGFGGRTMGAAYVFAHKEGHFPLMYKPWFRKYIGNIFENGVGCFFGNVPYNFSTSHNAIHHRLDAGWGDTFYQFDFDRTSFRDLQLYLYRILMHMTGWTSLNYFYRKREFVRYNKLLGGMITFFVVLPAVLLYVTGGSWWFMFFFYLEPVFCMTYFLAFMNFAFHAFVDYDEKGNFLTDVISTCIVDGQDDYFGEDDHMSHHNATFVYFKDLPKYREGLIENFKKHHASVFKEISIVELAAFILLGKWDLVLQHYKDYNEPGKGKLSDQEMIKLFISRAQRIEATHKEYSQWFAEGCPDTFEKPIFKYNRYTLKKDT